MKVTETLHDCIISEVNLPATSSLNGETRSIGEGLVVFRPHKLRALFKIGALKDQRDHTIVVHIHHNLIGSWGKPTMCNKIRSAGGEWQMFSSTAQQYPCPWIKSHQGGSQPKLHQLPLKVHQHLPDS